MKGTIAGGMFVVALGTLAACSATPQGSVHVTRVVVEPSHGCRIGISGTFDATPADAIVGVGSTAGPISLHPLVGGPAVGGHEGHLDNGGKRATRAVTSIALTKGTTTLRAHDLALMVDGGAAVLGRRTSVQLTFRFRSAPAVTVDAPVQLGSCR